MIALCVDEMATQVCEHYFYMFMKSFCTTFMARNNLTVMVVDLTEYKGMT